MNTTSIPTHPRSGPAESLTKRSPAPLLALVCALWGCQDILGLTPGKPDQNSGGTGGLTTTQTGGGGTSNTSSTTASGGSGNGGNGGNGGGGNTSTAGSGGGEPTCDSPCESTPCLDAACIGGECLVDPKPKSLFIEDPTPGDCKANLCNGLGGIENAPYFDPDTSNECLFATCENGALSLTPKANGTLCNAGQNTCFVGMCSALGCGSGGAMCGAGCRLLCDAGSNCAVSNDCSPGLFCSSGKCVPQVALAILRNGIEIKAATFTPNATPPWSVVTFGDKQSAAQQPAITFDASGNAIGVLRRGGVGAWVARWTSLTSWTAPLTWPSPTVATCCASDWTPSIAKTDAGAVVLFSKLKDQTPAFAAIQTDNTAPPEQISATSINAGSGAIRHGHVSYVYAPGGNNLFEARLLNETWTIPKAFGNTEYQYGDAPPTMIPFADGNLLVAMRRDDTSAIEKWKLQYIYFHADNTTTSDTIFGSAFDILPSNQRIALAPLANSNALLAFIGNDALLHVQIGVPSPGGAVLWTEQYTSPSAVAQVAVAKGIGGADAEVLYTTANSFVMHLRWAEGEWTTAPVAMNEKAAAIDIATP